METWRKVQRRRPGLARSRGEWRFAASSSPQSLKELQYAVEPPIVILVLVRDDHIGYVNAVIWGWDSVVIYEGAFEDGDILGPSVSRIKKDIGRLSSEEIRICSCAQDRPISRSYQASKQPRLTL